MNSVNSISTKSVGRPQGGSDAKEKILDAARKLFAENGFDRSSLRQIAMLAGVDPSLISHHFGSKQKLFVEAVFPLLDGPRLLPSAFEGDRATLGLRLATLFVSLASQPSTQDLMLGILRSVSSEEKAAEMVRRFMGNTMTATVTSQLPGPNKELQANILSGQMIGVFVARYIVKAEPIASISSEELIQYLTPRIQSYFDAVS